jgi:hypothetical protein
MVVYQDSLPSLRSPALKPKTGDEERVVSPSL